MANIIDTTTITGNFVIDLNYPGVVYSFPSALAAELGKTMMRKEGCAPKSITNPVIPDKESPSGVWDLKLAPTWWYAG